MFGEGGWFSGEQLVLLGAVVQTMAMLFRHQVILRVTFITGAAIYIAFYLVVLPTPLWEAAFASLAMATATFYGLVVLLVSRSKLIIPGSLMDLYHTIGGMEPGEFRSLMRSAARRGVETTETLTHEGEVPEKLYFIESGGMWAEKNSQDFTLPPEVFIGEVAFLTGKPASATVRVAPGARLVEWDAATLKRRIQRNSRVRLALEARIAEDLAGKVTRAVNSET
ncbi:cyclic nucleotide-binding domain-containing protein [Roseovarius ramblicola]|uniref:Cyclic nucleotide-binding domain-containing protein n=1 Tax=Roseovarius ramblicola TaxID=2022336 RepID=A0ABV5HWX1_9RHOB